MSLLAHKSAGCAQGQICRSFNLEDSSNVWSYPAFTDYLLLDVSEDSKYIYVYWNTLSAETLLPFKHEFKYKGRTESHEQQFFVK